MFVIYVYSKNEYVKEYLYHWILKIFFIFNRRLQKREKGSKYGGNIWRRFLYMKHVINWHSFQRIRLVKKTEVVHGVNR